MDEGTEVVGLRFVVKSATLTELERVTPIQLFWHPWRGLQLLATRGTRRR